MWSWNHVGNVAIHYIKFLLLSISLARVDVSAVSVRVTDSRSFAAALDAPSFTELILAPDRLVLGRRVLALQGRDWPGQVASSIDGRNLTIRSDPGDDLVEIDFNRIPWVIQVGANSTLELRDLNLTNLATTSKSGNGAFSQYLYVPGLTTWPSITSQPGGTIRVVNTTTMFWSRTLFKNPDCKYVGIPARPALEQATSVQGVEEISTLASGVVQVVDDDVIMQLPVLSLDNNTIVGAMLYAAKRSMAYCVPSLRSAPGYITGPADAPNEAPSDMLAPAPLPLPLPPAPSGKSVLVVVVSTVAAVAATVTAAATIALVLILRGRHHGPGDSEAAKARSADGKPMSRKLKRRGSLVSLESHLFRQSRMRRLTPLGSEEVEIGPIIGRGSFGHVYKGRWRNTLVAIKMVEHTTAVAPMEDGSRKSPPDSLQLEMLLSLSLCHPNIVATFRVCTVESGTLGRYGSGSSGAAGNAEALAPVDQRAVLPRPALPGIAEQPVQKATAQDGRPQSAAAPGAGAAEAASAAGAVPAAPGALRKCISDVTAALASVAEEPCGVEVVGPAPTAVCDPAAAAAVAERMQTGRAASEPPPTRGQAAERDASTSAVAPLVPQPRRAISLPRRLNWDMPVDGKPGTEQPTEQSAGLAGSTAAEKSGGHVQDVPVTALSMQNGVQPAIAGQNGVGGRNSDPPSEGLRRGATARCCPCVGSPATVESAPSAARQPDTAHIAGEMTNKTADAGDGAWDCEGEVKAKAHLETWMVMEYCERGSLEDMMRSGRFKLPNGHPNLPMIIACLLDIASGMAYLHAANVLHCDLKPANVLLKATSADKRGFICKLADFGLSRLLDVTHKSHVSTQTYGTMPYMPPEMLFESRLTQATDVYSFAMIMWELFSAQAVHAHMTFCQIFFAVVNERKRPALDAFERAVAAVPEDEPMIDSYLDLMQRCWADEPAHRPPFTAVFTELTALRGLGRRISAGRDSSRGSSS